VQFVPTVAGLCRPIGVHAKLPRMGYKAGRWGANDEWIVVPDTVPANLLATARWALGLSESTVE
jgi:hypothetical protein